MTPGSVGLGRIGIAGASGPLPTTRSCRRHRVYLNEPTSLAQS
ncbi:Uncharacterised protein [Mycobacteroides abscessus subsp. abscessus]|nr:Uncharacterised protein [Mycobacteroides abscessus subsp. abscessus]